MYNIHFYALVKKIASIRLSVLFILLIGLVLSISTFIEQDQSLEFYQQYYTTQKPFLGCIDWRLIFLLGLNHLYVSSGFITLLVLFCFSLILCTLNVQIPVLKRLRSWKFRNYNVDLKKTGFVLLSNLNNIFLFELYLLNYNIFKQGKRNYAYTGVNTRFGPIIVHI